MEVIIVPPPGAYFAQPRIISTRDRTQVLFDGGVYENAFDTLVFGSHTQNLWDPVVPILFDQAVLARICQGDGGDIIALPLCERTLCGALVLRVPDIYIQSGLMAAVPSAAKGTTARHGHIADLYPTEITLRDILGEVLQEGDGICMREVSIAASAHELVAISTQGQRFPPGKAAVGVGADTGRVLGAGAVTLLPGIGLGESAQGSSGENQCAGEYPGASEPFGAFIKERHKSLVTGKSWWSGHAMRGPDEYRQTVY